MFEQGVNLKERSHYRIGGIARFFLPLYKPEDAEGAFNIIKKEKVLILGGGTNVLFPDEEFKGLIVKPEFSGIYEERDLIRVAAGTKMEDLVEFFANKGYSGMEWAAGLPGSVGGAIFGNAGAFGGETKDAVVSVTSFDFSGRKPKFNRRENNECFFNYRSSVFKRGNGKEIILEAFFNFTPGDKKQIREAIEEKLHYRASRMPLEYPSLGSMFKNVMARLLPKKHHAFFADKIKTDPFPVVPAACLITEAGLKGVSIGGAMISPKHPNFIVNVLDAKSRDVHALLGLVKDAVKKKFGVKMEEEIVIVN